MFSLKKTFFISFLVIMLLPLLSGAKEMLLCLPGFAGTSSQAQPYVDKMMRYLEKKLNLTDGSMAGKYFADEVMSVSELRSNKPEVALVGPSVFAPLQKDLGMKVIAEVTVNGRGEEIYSVVSKKGGVASLSELKGKTLSGAVVSDEKYVVNVLLDKQVSLGDLKLVPQERPLKSLRSVVRGEAEAAIVDQSVIDHLKDLPFAGDLNIIFESKPVPAPAVVVMGKGLEKAEALKEALVGMCKRPDGVQLCKTLTISGIRTAAIDKYKKLIKRYNR